MDSREDGPQRPSGTTRAMAGEGAGFPGEERKLRRPRWLSKAECSSQPVPKPKIRRKLQISGSDTCTPWHYTPGQCAYGASVRHSLCSCLLNHREGMI